MNNDVFSSIDVLPLSLSDSDLIGTLIESIKNQKDRAALWAALAMLLRQRNLFAYKVGEFLDPSSAVQSELFQKAMMLQTLLNQANASVELQYQASLVLDHYDHIHSSAESTIS